MTELLLSRAGNTLDSQSSERLALVIKAVSRMERLIRDLMDLAKATDASTRPTSDVDMRAVAEMAIANLGQAIRESGARIILEELPLVHANETAMVRLVQNLIANAIKYRTDTPPVIHISASRRKQDSTFSIRDNGIGIAPEYTQKIFEPFQRLHGRADYEGSGLGLAACRRIVEALNGTIWVESKGGEGSTFFFTIPQEANPDRKAPAREGDAASLNRVQQSPPRNAQRAAHGGLH
jgi:light-regulated signal transduction histidine kinase (bacteriophytochrome)